MTGEKPKQVMSAWQLLCRLGSLLRPYWKESLCVVLLMTIDPAFSLMLAFSFKILIDDAIPKHQFGIVRTMIAVLSFGWILSSLAAVARDYFYSRVGTFVVNDVRRKVFEHLQSLSMSFYARSQIGDLMSRFTNDVERLEDVIVGTLSTGIWGFLSIIMSFSFLMVYEWKMALLSLLSLPLCLIGPWLCGSRAAEQTYAVQEKIGEVASTVQENLGAQQVIKAFGLQSVSSARFADQLSQLSVLACRASFISYLTLRSSGFGLSLYTVLAVSVGALLALYGYLTAGELVAMQGILLDLSNSFSETIDCYPQLVQAAAGMQRIDDLLEERPQVCDAPHAGPLRRPLRQIELRHVNFGYTPSKLNLADVSLMITANTSNAVVGTSGSGKSTILNLITRLYDTESGEVLVDGIDVRSVEQNSLRAQIAMVFQESILFNGTVRENIRVGRSDATDAEVEAAARLAEVHEAILGFEHGYDTVAGERGGRFSGGQRQRIAIARALLRGSSVLIFDEATSALDSVAEQQINQTISRLARGRTLISVTHRLSTIIQYDQIFVLQDGRLVEQGRHSELLESNGTYAGLWNKQSGFQVNEEFDHVDVTADRLKAIPILSKFDPTLLTELAHDFNTESYPHGTIVVREGDPADKFYIIVRGQVDIFHEEGMEGEESSERRLATLQDGDYFGERALLRNVPRAASVRTLGECIFLVLPRKKFARLLERAPHLREDLIREYAP